MTSGSHKNSTPTTYRIKLDRHLELSRNGESTPCILYFENDTNQVRIEPVPVQQKTPTNSTSKVDTFAEESSSNSSSASSRSKTHSRKRPRTMKQQIAYMRAKVKENQYMSMRHIPDVPIEPIKVSETTNEEQEVRNRRPTPLVRITSRKPRQNSSPMHSKDTFKSDFILPTHRNVKKKVMDNKCARIQTPLETSATATLSSEELVPTGLTNASSDTVTTTQVAEYHNVLPTTVLSTSTQPTSMTTAGEARIKANFNSCSPSSNGRITSAKSKSLDSEFDFGELPSMHT